MIKCAKILGLALASLVLLTASAKAAEPTIRGRIIEIDRDTSTLLVTIKGRFHRVKTFETTQINKDGRGASFDDFEVRDLVRATGMFDSEDKKTRILEAHTVVAVNVDGPGHQSRLKGLARRVNRETNEFTLLLDRFKVRVKVIEGSTEVYVNGKKADISTLKDRDSVSAVGNLQRSGDGSYILTLTAKKINIIRLRVPGPPELP